MYRVNGQSRVRSLALTALLWLCWAPGVAQEATSGGEDAVMDRLQVELIDDFVASRAGDTPEAIRPHLRAFMTRLDVWLVTEVPDQAARARARTAAHDRLRQALNASFARETNGEDAATRAAAALTEAVTFDHQRRRDQILGDLMCWCPRPACNFTRTVAACPDPCADEQKSMVDAWLGEGLSDQEVFARMVAHPKGGPRVHSTPRVEGSQRLGFYFPLILAAVAAVAVFSFLGRAAGRGRRAAAEVSTGATHEDDARWENEIERELKEMDD